MNVLCRCLFGVFLVVAVVQSAPRSRSKSSKGSTTYDQKQTGEYNIQLHLKDFQIIAVVGEDSFGALGDYDYEYDYSDFTVKPIGGSTTTTKKPETASSTDKPPISTTKKTDHPYPIVSPSTPTTVPPAPTTQKENETPEKTTQTVETTAKVEESSEDQKESSSTETAQASSSVANLDKELAASTSEALYTSDDLNGGKETSTSTVKIDVKSSAVAANVPGQIPVFLKDASGQVHPAPSVISLKDFLDKKGAVTNVAIVPTEDINSETSEQPALGEILHYKCAQGFAKDKRGRCRKIRRPISGGITRFASSLASRLRSHSAHSYENLEN